MRTKSQEESIRVMQAQNSYRAGVEAYEKGEMERARGLLGRVSELAKDIPEAQKAEQLVGNIDVLRGNAKVTTTQEKAAAAQVTGEQSGVNTELELKQQRYIEGGNEALRMGQLKSAQAQFEAAQSLGGKLQSQGAKAVEQTARISEAAKGLSTITEMQLGKVEVLQKQLEHLKKEGDYSSALETAKQLKEVGGTSGAVDSDKEINELNLYVARAEADGKRRQEQTIAATPVKPRGGGPGGTMYLPQGNQPSGMAYIDVDKNWQPETPTPDGRGPVRRLPSDEVQPGEPDTLTMGGPLLAGTGHGGGAAGTGGGAADQGRKRPTDKTTGRDQIIRGKVWGTEAADSVARQLAEREVQAGLVEGLQLLGQNRFDEAEKRFLTAQTRVRYSSYSDEWKKQWLGIIQDHLDRAAMDKTGYATRLKSTRGTTTQTELDSHLVRMRDLQERQYQRLMAQWEIFYERKQYDDALLVLKQARVLKPGDADLVNKEMMTLAAKPGQNMLGAMDGTESMSEQMTPWSEVYRYPNDWKELSDRRESSEGAVQQRLRDTKVSVEFKGQTLKDVAEYLGTVGGVNVVLGDAKLADPGRTVSLKLTNVPLETVIRQVAEQAGVGYGVRDQVVVIGEKGAQAPETVVYEVRDLTAGLPEFKGPSFELGKLSETERKQAEETKAKEAKSAAETLEKIKELVKESVAPGTWDKGGNRIEVRNGTIVASNHPEVQHQVSQLLEEMRNRKGQVQVGQTLAFQRAEQRGRGQNVAYNEGHVKWKSSEQQAEDERFLKRFMEDNYGWYLDENGDAGVQVLRDKLAANNDEKVLVSSGNLNVDERDAAALGVRFTEGVNGVRYAIVDEGQLRTLVEMGNRRSPLVGMNIDNNQETIVGTDAWLANGMTGNVRFAGDRGNMIDVMANGIELPHDRYVVIDNRGYLTAVKAGPMQNWQEKVTPVRFSEGFQGVEVPRVGRLMKLEKTLLNPEDETVIMIEYTR